VLLRLCDQDLVPGVDPRQPHFAVRNASIAATASAQKKMVQRSRDAAGQRNLKVGSIVGVIVTKKMITAANANFTNIPAVITAISERGLYKVRYGVRPSRTRMTRL